MIRTVTRMVLLALLVAGVTDSYAQSEPGPPLGDDFIFFANGTNTAVPNFDGTVVDDPLNSENKVVQYNYGNWSFQAFRFDAAVGVDMTANREGADVLSLSLLVDPANAGQPNVGILMEDKTDGSGANDGTADLPFRLVWRIPEHYRNGEWHDLQIPFPPATFAELEAGKMDGSLDSLANYWVYAGAWSSGGFGVGVADELGPETADNPQLWQEYEWTNVQNIGAFFDNNTGGGPIYFDNVYIGGKDFDISVASNPPAAMSGVTFEAAAGVNRISWTHNPDFSGYNVYTSLEPITDISAATVSLAERVTADADATMLEVKHSIAIPHESLAPLDVHYAVTSLSAFGVENADVSNSGGMVANPDLPIQALITELTEAEAEQLFDNLTANDASGKGFPDWLKPFEVNTKTARVGDVGEGEWTDEDLSAKVWAGYSADNELFLYTEVTDDQISVAGESVSAADAWMHDSIEFGWGNYDVRDVEGGSIFGGSPHTDMERGDFADYQLRVSGHGDGTKAGTASMVYVGWGLDGIPAGGGAAYDVLMDGDGNTTGYKMLALFPLDAIQDAETNDAVLDPPLGTEMRFIPFLIALNDGDESNRDLQIIWSSRGNAGANWWNTPAQWLTVAMAGRLTATDTEDSPDEIPDEIVLDQNYPNPFNPATSIQFALPSTQRVTLQVFDMLGRPVATLLQGKQLSSGSHTVRFDGSALASGVYVYRLEAGGTVVQSRRMLLAK